MFDLFNRVPRRELCYDRFCEEKPTGVKSLEVAVFRKYKETEAPFWREIILRELGKSIREICEDALERLYAADFGEGVTAVFLRFRPRTPAAVKAELTSDVCSWLDACPDSFCVRLCRGPQLRALERAGIEPLADTK